MLPISGTLPASKTHATRRWTFIENADYTQPGLGVVTLIQGRRDLDSYAIDVEEGELLFAKLDDSAEVYGVTLNRVGQPVKCNCTGFQLLADGAVCLTAAEAA
jgi:hypothetical protein